MSAVCSTYALHAVLEKSVQRCPRKYDAYLFPSRCIHPLIGNIMVLRLVSILGPARGKALGHRFSWHWLSIALFLTQKLCLSARGQFGQAIPSPVSPWHISRQPISSCRPLASCIFLSLATLLRSFGQGLANARLQEYGGGGGTPCGFGIANAVRARCC